MEPKPTRPKKGGRTGKWVKRIGIGVLILVCAVAIALTVSVWMAPDYRTVMTPAGYPVNDSFYVPLEDGDQVWVSVWLPDNLQKDQRIPALVKTSRYSWQMEPGWLYKVRQTWQGARDLNKGSIQYLLDAGYAYVWIQSPGSCQSTGVRYTEYPPSEIEAMRRVGLWIEQQPWSNGRFGAFGTSYSATTSDMMAATGVDGARAVYAKAPDFDTYTQLIKPGGIGTGSFVHTWGNMVKAMDRDDLVGMMEDLDGRKYSALERFLTGAMIAGLQRPDPNDMPIFEQALKDHQRSPTVEELVAAMAFKDTPSARSENGLSMDDIGVYNYTDAIEASNTFMYTRVGWMDAGVAEGALEKYLTMNRPQRIVIQPSGHVFSEIVDPYNGTRPKTVEERKADQAEFFNYFDRFLKNGETSDERKIEYYTYVMDEWRETDVWPPAGLMEVTRYFGPDGSLVSEQSDTEDATDAYTVDFTATTGKTNRWMTQMGRTAAYGDRAKEDEKLLCYTSEPLQENTELTGSVTLTLYVASTHEDGAFYVYLEDVAPDGRVTYLSEQRLRGTFRRTTDAAEAPYVSLGVYRAFSRNDVEPMVPGEIMELKLTLLPVSTVIRAGHSIRIALAGHDAAVETRVPEAGVPEWTVYRNTEYPSHVELPLKALQEDL